jgi:hypothetical protein
MSKSDIYYDHYTQTHNQRMYADFVKNWMPEINKDDLAFVCNRAASIYQKIDDGTVDNFRVCRRLEGGDVTARYREVMANGCCGFHDETFYNPKTGNIFSIGFNYGH